MKTKKPKPEVELSFAEINGNAFGILAKVQKALKAAGYTKEECEKYYTEATSGDHKNLLKVTEKWVEVI